jgi:hypothetical protein
MKNRFKDILLAGTMFDPPEARIVCFISGFQQQVYNQPAQAVAGNFASRNPHFTFDAGPGGLVAGAAGVTVGRFAWVSPPLDPNGTCQIALNSGAGQVAGLVPNELQGLNTVFLSDGSMLIPQGFMVTLMTGGDFWVVNNGATEALPLGPSQAPMKAYAKFTDGTVAFAATGSPPNAASVTGSIAASTFSITGSIGGVSGNVLTVTNVSSGTIVNGATISGTGIATGTKIINQLTGTAGGVGTYTVSIDEQTVASTTVSGTYGTLTVTATGSGAITLGDVLSGSGVTTGTTVTQFGTGTGGNGTYFVDPTQTAGSTTITAAGYVETKWFAMSSGLTGELVKISDHAIG